MIKKYDSFYSKMNEETGFKNIKKLIEQHKREHGDDFEIWFHMDLDGICSALCIKKYLEDYGMKLLDTHIIQYGGIEYAVANKQPDSMAVLVDYAHFRTMFTIASDHHSDQAGKAGGTSYAKPTRSNAETLSGIITTSDAFTDTDIKLIQTVDSANFLEYDITPEDVQNSIFKYKKDLSSERNRFLMGFVVNRLLLALKNKRISVKSLDGKRSHINKNLLECLVMDCNPSLYSIFNNLRHYINNAVSLEWDRSSRSHHSKQKLTTPEEIENNLMKYIETRKPERFNKKVGGFTEQENVTFDEDYKILKQYGIGYVIPTGSYDRYVVFKNFPDAEFVCTIFPMGLIQVSCNPFKEKRLKDIDLGAIAKEVLALFKSRFEKINISISDVKRISEMDIEKMGTKFGSNYKAVGFKFEDLMSLYKDKVFTLSDRKDKKSVIKLNFDNKDKHTEFIEENVNEPYATWDDDVKREMNWYKISLLDIIEATSGGHKSITNLQSLNYMSCRKDLLKILFNTEEFTAVMKIMADKFIENLKSKIDLERAGKEVTYNTGDVVLKSDAISESYEYVVISNDGKQNVVTQDKFLSYDFVPKRDFKIDSDSKRIIGTVKDIKDKDKKY